MSLSVCSECARHVKSTAGQCVFCGASTLEGAARPSTAMPLRMSAMMLGAITIATASACTPAPAMTMYGGPPPELVDASVPDAEPVAVPSPVVTAYGAAPLIVPDAGSKK